MKRPWIGTSQVEASRMVQRALAGGMTRMRSLVLGHVASMRDCWAFRSHLAELVRCSVRTVARALAEGEALGLIRRARGKRREAPPNAKGPLPCGWSHRWTTARGLVGQPARRAINLERVKHLTRWQRRGKPRHDPRIRRIIEESLGLTPEPVAPS